MSIRKLLSRWSLVVLAFAAIGSGFATAALADSPAPSGSPDFGPNVHIFSPGTPQSEIQATVDAIAAQQVNNEFGQQRYALLFEPGTYGTKQNPLNFQIGYYTMVAGLGLSPNDVVINGSIDVFNRCLGANNTNCVALVNFWRSMSNLTINVTKPNGCRARDFWAVSQAAPMRRVQFNGDVTLMDYCTPPSYASGGFIADSVFAGGIVVNGSQQQFIVRNSNVDLWTNAVWNQVFSGVVGAPAQSFPNPPFTTLATSPITREAPFLYMDSEHHFKVFVPAVQRNSSGTSWAAGPTAGSSISIEDFFVARPVDSVSSINRALRRGMNLILTPGVYPLERTVEVTRPDTVVLGLGFATLTPQHGRVAMSVAGTHGVLLSGLLFDAGADNSSVLLQVGGRNGENDSRDSDPSALQDVFFRIGGAAAGKATTSLVVNSDNVILDDIWAWRADHGNGVGWTVNTADTGVIVNGDNVTAYGLFVEHYQKFEVKWNGDGGTIIFFQNEMPYDPPSQAAWMEAPGVDGWAAIKVGSEVEQFKGYGLGSYSFFNQGLDIFAAHAFEVPTTLPAGSLHDLLTIFLDATHGKGGILHVVNDAGGSSTIANPDTPVAVVSYP
ncbi:MAG TPA: adenylyl cyclase [Candidatus Dormibacteraeota bacterium]